MLEYPGLLVSVLTQLLLPEALFFSFAVVLVKYVITTLHFGRQHYIRNVLFWLRNNDRPV